jgi:MFS family permease
MMVISGLTGILTVPKITAFSDRVGRRPMFLIVLCGLLLSDVILFVCVQFPTEVDYRVLLFKAFAEGVGGGPALGAMRKYFLTLLNIAAALLTLVISYITDSVRPDIRGAVLAYPDMVLGIGAVFGPLTGSLLYKHTQSFGFLMLCCLACDAIVLITFILLVPESRTLKARRLSQALHSEALVRRAARAEARSRPRRFFDAINIFHPLLSLRFKHLSSYPIHRRNAWILIVCLAVLMDIIFGFLQVAVIYSETIFQWTAVETGYIISILGGAKVVQLSLIYPVVVASLRRIWHFSTHRLDLVDTTVIRIALAACCVSMAVIAYAPNGSVFLVGLIGMSFGSLSSPIIKNAIIKYSQRNSVGEVMGALGFVTSTCLVTAPLLFFSAYKWTLDTRPYFVFELTTALYAVLMLVTLLLRPVRDPLDDTGVEESLDEVESQ